MNRFFILAALLLFGLSVPLTGCDEDSSQRTQTRGAPGGSKKKRKKKKKALKGTTVDKSKLPAKLRDVDWDKVDDLAKGLKKTRDPFRPSLAEMIVKAEDDGEQQPVTQIKTTISDSSVNQLQLIAIITGTAVHKAMVTDGRGLGHIVRQGDIVGQKPPMRVMRITRNEVIFKALSVAENEKEPREVRKALLTQEELQELQP